MSELSVHRIETKPILEPLPPLADRVSALPNQRQLNLVTERPALDAPVPFSVVEATSTARGLGASRYSSVARLAKRGVDVLVAASLLVLLAPLWLMIAGVIRSTSDGPALFRQKRVGYRERPFTIAKFRTMATDNDPTEHREFVQAMIRGDIPVEAAGDDSVYKLENDPRITKVGAWLRRTSLDEIPQLINVIKGEMSLVGPRPCLDYEVSEYAPHHRLRATSMPGLTGLWQVGGRSNLHFNEALDLDLEYVRSCSLWGDLKILVQTLKVPFSGTGV